MLILDVGAVKTCLTTFVGVEHAHNCFRNNKNLFAASFVDTYYAIITHGLVLSAFDQYEPTLVTANVSKGGRFWNKMLRSFDHGLSIRLSRNERDFKRKSFLFVLRTFALIVCAQRVCAGNATVICHASLH